MFAAAVHIRWAFQSTAYLTLWDPRRCTHFYVRSVSPYQLDVSVLGISDPLGAASVHAFLCSQPQSISGGRFSHRHIRPFGIRVGAPISMFAASVHISWTF